MHPFAQFIQTTQKLKTHLEQTPDSNERDEYIQTVQKLLDERRALLDQFQDLSLSLTDEQKERLVALEKELQKLLNKQMEEIKKDIRTLNLKKKKGNHYGEVVPPGFSIDGTFLDKRK